MKYAKTQNDPNLPRGWSKYRQGTMAYNRLHGEEEGQRKKPLSQINSEEKREVDNKKKKFKEFLAVMMSKGKKVKDQTWNESFNDFVPTDQTKSRRERKREERLKKEQKSKEQGEEPVDENNILQIKKEEVLDSGKGVTITQKEILKKSTKLGTNISKQTHIKFDGGADISEAVQRVENINKENDIVEEELNNQENEEDKKDEGEEIDENRLYCMNLPFTITEEELRETFGQYGEIDEISIPKRRGGLGTGF